jgi:hypothetical protein
MQHNIPTRETERSFEQAGKPFDKAAYMAALPLNLRRNIVHEIDRLVAGSIYDHIKDPRWRKNRQELFTRCLANLRIADEQCIPVRLSQRRGDYSTKEYGYRVVASLLEKMFEAGLIDWAKGHFNRENGWECGDQTWLWTTHRLLELYAVINPDEIVLEPPELVQIRKRQTYLQKLKGQEALGLPAPKNRRVLRMVRQLEHYGELLQQTLIVFHKGPGDLDLKELNKLVELFRRYNYDRLKVLEFPMSPIVCGRSADTLTEYSQYRRTESRELSPGVVLENRKTHTGNIAAILKYKQLHRVFTDNLKLGGRYYGASWQMFSENLRKHLFINGYPVVEWDFSGLHLRMLYHLEGMDYKGDPYGFGSRQERPYLKLVSLLMINKKTRQGLLRAMKKTFAANQLDIPPDEQIERMVARFNTAHDQINRYFCSDIGLRLQYLDSQITSDILDYFLEKGIPVLPIHDSYIVAEQYEDELYEVMKEKYRDHMGFDPVIMK